MSGDLPTIVPRPDGKDADQPALHTQLTGYERSTQVAEVADRVIAQHQALAYLVDYEVVYLVHHEPPPEKPHDIVKVGLLGGWQQALSTVDAALIVNAQVWEVVSDRQREAMVLHGLLHFGQNDKSGKLVTVPHDVEEFGLVAATYGAWRPGLREFGDQLSLGLGAVGRGGG
jgi:hypothetical protein